MKIIVAIYTTAVNLPAFSTTDIFRFDEWHQLANVLGEDKQGELAKWVEAGGQGYLTLNDIHGKPSVLVFTQEI
jgi:hypothetical protein